MGKRRQRLSQHDREQLLPGSKKRVIAPVVQPAAWAIALIDAPSRPDASNTRRAAATMSRRRWTSSVS